jgi:cytochrome c oxidase assembly protein subunit 15
MNEARAVHGASSRFASIHHPRISFLMLHRFACLVATCTLLLIVAGGMVTSTSSGLAVPDWPTTYGYMMFSFPPSMMVGGIFYEHGHRLIASTVGLLTIILAVWLQRSEPRRWVRRLGWLALGAVILQGTLGGVTVMFFLPPAVSIAHAGLAQIFFCLTVSLAVVTSPRWMSRSDSDATVIESGDSRLSRLTVWVVAAIYLQILVGAAMRHTGAGLAIPDFPLVFGGIVPDTWSPAIAVHYAHRVGALVVAGVIFSTAYHINAHQGRRGRLRRLAMLLCGLVVVQVALGGLTILSGRLPEINTAHVATGALVLATSVVLALRANRARFADAAAEDLHDLIAAGRLEQQRSVGARA